MSLVATSDYILTVHPSLPARSVKELIALARSKPSALTHASRGNLGRPAAFHLRDNGIDVVVASPRPSAGERAGADGFTVVPVDSAIREGDVLWLALPDELVPELLSASAPARPHRGSLVCLSSGYSLAYGLLKLPDDVVALFEPDAFARAWRASLTAPPEGVHRLLVACAGEQVVGLSAIDVDVPPGTTIR